VSAAGFRRQKRSGFFLASLAALLSACDFGGPGGPAEVLGTVTGHPRLGAAVIDLSWDGVTSLEGRGSTQVYTAPVPGSETRHRAVLVDATGGELRFTISLSDDRLDAPALTVVSAVGTDNLQLPVGDLRVVLER
jgi:hypothetical protein